jgi:hypothetical protein
MEEEEKMQHKTIKFKIMVVAPLRVTYLDYDLIILYPLLTKI